MVRQVLNAPACPGVEAIPTRHGERVHKAQVQRDARPGPEVLHLGGSDLPEEEAAVLAPDLE